MGYVAQDPINFTDSTGLASDCTRPLKGALGNVGVTHEFVCYTGDDGQVHCGGLGPTGNPFTTNPGQIESDSPNASCQDKGKGCMDKCVEQALKAPTPNYNVFTNNCHHFAQNILNKCAAQCGGK